MAYPATAPVLTNQQSIDSIVESEAIILQNLNDLYCTDFVAGILADATLTGEDKLNAMSAVLNTMACKECTVANILESASKVLVVDKGLVPAGGSGATSCAYCN